MARVLCRSQQQVVTRTKAGGQQTQGPEHTGQQWGPAARGGGGVQGDVVGGCP
jgi:hypothetical protein